MLFIRNWSFILVYLLSETKYVVNISEELAVFIGLLSKDLINLSFQTFH